MNDSRWPKEWVLAIEQRVDGTSGQHILDALHAVGALREVPKPKIWFICRKCKIATMEAELIRCNCNQTIGISATQDWIVAKEVLE